MTIEKLKAFVAAGEKCTKFDLTSCKSYDDLNSECPLCDGEGYVETDTYINIDNVPLNVQFSGIGEAHVNWHKFIIKAANIRSDLPAIIAKFERMEEALMTILIVSEFYAQDGLADYLMRYAHEKNFKVARQALED